MSVELVVDTANFESKMPEFVRLLRSLPNDMLSAAAEIVEDQMRQEVPVVSGRLQSSITSQVFDDQAIVQTNTGYGKAVDEGRRGFDLNKGPPGALRFFINGKMIFRHHVHVGPAKARHFKDSTILNSGSRIMAMMDQKLDSELSAV